MYIADIILCFLFGNSWKPKLTETEVGFCAHCQTHAATNSKCNKSLDGLHHFAHGVRRGSLDADEIALPPLLKDRSLWLMAGIVVSYLTYWQVAKFMDHVAKNQGASESTSQTVQSVPPVDIVAPNAKASVPEQSTRRDDKKLEKVEMVGVPDASSAYPPSANTAGSATAAAQMAANQATALPSSSQMTVSGKIKFCPDPIVDSYCVYRNDGVVIIVGSGPDLEDTTLAAQMHLVLDTEKLVDIVGTFSEADGHKKFDRIERVTIQ